MDLSQYDFVDFGCSAGGSIRLMERLFGGVGIGFDADPDKVATAKRCRAHLASMSDQSMIRDAASLKLSVWNVDDVADESGGLRRQYQYRVESTVPGAYAVHEGEDLHLGVDALVDADVAMRTLASFLATAGESYRYVTNHPGSAPENLDLFPSWVAEAAYLNADELAMLAAEEELAPPAQAADRPSRAGLVLRRRRTW